MAESTNGVWLDKATGKIVHSQPERGRQIVPPGRSATNAEKATVELYRENTETVAAELHDAPTEGRAVQSSHMGSEKAPVKKAAAKKAAPKG
ncbi:hypothetical protein PO878_03965 [Iamia majanohamensis]|uniref:Uncharacterized protein n=1 Tax=Iamia majanohamensis TaxID=467976 RepID=A0AAE9Y701_9ACTN|nr:hypothetical protein [Iamia majanohamensis]WCO67879.1 hypothetical protein PO878_03965 [Iamia majanohamensis]